MTDKELMQKVHSGDKSALETVIDQYYADIYRFCFYMIQEEQDAYDLTQEVFLKFIKYNASYQQKNLKGYLLTIARNICFNYFRNKKNTFPLWEQNEQDNRIMMRDEYNNIETAICFQELLGKMSDEMREVVILRIYEEMKFREIAKIMGTSISTAKSRFRLGVNYLKKEMEDED